ncbi:Ig-like domain-containing protein, partial [Bacillus sp. JJ1764]|uniref:Ig-like domain-containing protein n=1 Tax=Bacillus sp. JJ1764 TaxID=3122964 RepID=UPI002FFF9806
KGTAEKGSTVVAKVNGKDIGRATANRYGQFSIIIKKQKAGTVVVVVASDRAGNVSKAASIRVKDATAPLAPSVNKVRISDKVITGKAEVDSIVIAKVNGREIGRAKVNAKGQFAISIAKQNANTKISVTATDASGNQSRATVVIVTKTPVKPGKEVKSSNFWLKFENWY